MQKALNFLLENKEVAFATVGNGKPQIRVFQIMRQQGSNLYFATSPHKEVYSQLSQNPAVELLAMRGNISVRVGGEACFDVDDAMQREIYSANPVLPRLYPSYRDLVYFRLPIARLHYYDLTPTPPLQEYFELIENH